MDLLHNMTRDLLGSSEVSTFDLLKVLDEDPEARVQEVYQE